MFDRMLGWLAWFLKSLKRVLLACLGSVSYVIFLNPIYFLPMVNHHHQITIWVVTKTLIFCCICCRRVYYPVIEKYNDKPFEGFLWINQYLGFERCSHLCVIALQQFALRPWYTSKHLKPKWKSSNFALGFRGYKGNLPNGVNDSRLHTTCGVRKYPYIIPSSCWIIAFFSYWFWIL